MKISVVWLKRDLRLTDHEPLAAAAREGLPTLLLYCFEPHILSSEDSDIRHVRFCAEALQDMQLSLQEPCLLVSHREVIESLEIVSEFFEVVHLFSYEEVGNLLTFRRDKAVKSWSKQRGILYVEFEQNGTLRGRKHRQGWQENLDTDYFTNKIAQHQNIKPAIVPHSLVERLCDASFKTSESDARFQRGGESYARRYLQSFLQQRHHQYSRTLSQPHAARRGCSRLSPYLAFGCISARQVYQATVAAKGSDWNMKNFLSRLWWRSHYIQKLETDFRIEFEPINMAFQGLNRLSEGGMLEAWMQGRTGYPMVDASMRCLQATGWVNFRMRAMLATFASFGLWLDFRPLALHLAKLFLDYDPGIHYPQIQMQAGLTGYHTLRIFNPTHQILKYDPEGVFIKTWLPELSRVPMPLLAEPWKMSLMEQTFYQCRIGYDYPAPLVDYEKVLPINRDRYWQIRQSPQAKALLPRIWQKFCLPQDIAKYKLEADSCRFEV